MQQNVDEVSALKDQGTKLFGQKDYKGAIDCFTRAIELDGSNAVLYANRAACYNSPKQFQEGLLSALKVSLDTHWGAVFLSPLPLGNSIRSILCERMAASLGSSSCMSLMSKVFKCYVQSVQVRTNRLMSRACGNSSAPQGAGLALSPPSRAKKAGQQQIKLCISDFPPLYCNLEQWPRKNISQPRMGPLPDTTGLPPGDSPPERAPAIVRLCLIFGNPESSSLVLMHAKVDFEIGLKFLIYSDFRKPGVLEYATVNVSYQPIPRDALVSLSGAYTTDERAMYVDNLDYTGLVKRMIAYEMHQSGAPDPALKMESVTSGFLRLRRQGGWARVRPAITITVRCLLLRGHVSISLRRDYETGYNVLNKAFKILTWGRQEWPDAEEDLRGVVFSDTFYAGVFRLMVKAYELAYKATKGRNRLFRLEELLQSADDLITYAKSIRGTDTKDMRLPGMPTAFISYPEAQGHSTKGWCLEEYVEAGLCKDQDDEDTHRIGALTSFFSAANLYAKDDEHHVEHLNHALNMLFRLETPLGQILAVMERMRLATPGVKAIWEHSALMRGSLEETLQRVASFEADLRERMEKGEPGYGLGDVVPPPSDSWLSH
ncbi:hypothetical protein BV25DRAFT_1988937 [Artomyces pyxidatus]|uniref:Uncharacterized protein n=1 Tax=Artomyces pyxidatus TaxID=48021 RepID=A0ACB8TBB5_9AGAM|nr:hypothetical protein BV25DRAFT_1988937 [Artomyces pyxidatus]